MTTDDALTVPDQPAFGDLDAYLAMPRVSGLHLSPDGRRVVVGTGVPTADGSRIVTSLWEVDPGGEGPARRLTRGDGESAAAFAPGGDLLFTAGGSGRGTDGGRPALWALPAAGGEARLLLAPAGGTTGVTVAADGTVVLGSELLPSATDPADDERLRETRRTAGTAAVLHEGLPVRSGARDLGPAAPRLLTTRWSGAADIPVPRDLTGHAGAALDGSTWDVTPDGRTVVARWTVPAPGGRRRGTLVAVDTVTGRRRVIADHPGHEYAAPRISPDATLVAAEVRRPGDLSGPDRQWLALLPLDGGPERPLTAGWDRMPHSARWTPDGRALIVAADHHGRRPLWRVDAVTGEAVRLTPDAAAYSDVAVSPDGRYVYALRAALDSPPAPVRIALEGEGARVTALRGPAEESGPAPRLPGHLEEVHARATDGTPLRGWLVLPQARPDGVPAPLLLWVHGGPLGSWNTWSWRWNPWIAASAGYAVLLPDPAASTGYGTDFLRRGWSAWREAPVADLLAVTAQVMARPDIDAERSAVMGGSFGGWAANWMAGHTDRFRAAVSHASVWDLPHCNSVTDLAAAVAGQTTPEAADADSPHHAVAAIRTPMLVSHGGRDHRVPVSQSLHLWWDLSRHHMSEDGTTPHKFLLLPDEGHGIRKPSNLRVWYETVLSFLGHHLRDEPWHRPELVG